MVAFIFFFCHGYLKSFSEVSVKTPIRFIRLWGSAGLIEFFGGIFLALGLFTVRGVYLQRADGHRLFSVAFLPQRRSAYQKSRRACGRSFAFVFLFIAAHGGGTWSLNALRRRLRVSTLRGARGDARTQLDRWHITIKARTNHRSQDSAMLRYYAACDLGSINSARGSNHREHA